MKRSAIFKALAFTGVCACSGCGLVPFPVSRTLPDPIRRVEVLQEGTRQPVTNAEVVIHAERFKNWMRSFPPHYSADFTPATTTSVVIQVHEAAPGCFAAERRRVWRYVRPWGVGPLGTTIHEDYAMTVSVRAEDYSPVTATYTVGALNPDPRITERAHFVAPYFETNGTLLVFVHTRHAEPDGAANGSQPFRSETNSTSSAAGSRR
jgi:hypothetical protein